MPSTIQRSTLFSAVLVFLLSFGRVGASESPTSVQFRKNVQPVLTEYCGDCHMDGAKKGNVAFDEYKTEEELFAKRDLWLTALKNVRAGLMPPPKKPHPTAENIQALEKFIKSEIFDIDPANPDPGKVTIRRLNRYEYRNTIRDLTGYDYKVEEELPPDDTGFGFDNIGDVLTISPILMEKYMQAAEVITTASVPRTSSNPRERVLVETGRRNNNGRMSFYDTNKISNTFRAEKAGTYRVNVDVEVFGQFDFDPGIVDITFKANDKIVMTNRLGWQSFKLHKITFEDKWEPGSVPLVMEVTPVTPKEKKTRFTLELRLAGLRVEGPLEKEYWVRPKNFERFFTQDPPTDAKARRAYAREVLKRFAEKAYRHPVDDKTADRLAVLAEEIYNSPGKRFEDGVAAAMTPILASPRFLFRIEGIEASKDPKAHPLIDEYSLASRLSYFLWSTMPDEELFKLAAKHELRKNLPAQVKRLLADSRADAFMSSFVGQWLQVRDVDGIDINARTILQRDGNTDTEARKRRQRLEELRDIPEEKLTAEQKAEMAEIRAKFNAGRNNNPYELNGQLRTAMREETEKTFAYIARENRSMVELIDADYTFLNERLAFHYGIKGVSGQEMRLVKLDPDSPRGGVLTDGATLVVTSNPTRTSPVKRGLFVLDNILGMPPPPPPPDVPALEEAEGKITDKTPTLRRALEIHREKPLCSSCHNRMDPLGFALENFNALGMWRDNERGEKIDAAGSLVTGDEFSDIRQVKKVLASKFRTHFYRAITEKLMTYALGRGVDYYDVETVDQIVANLQRDDGRFNTLLTGIIDSPAFQKRRNPDFQETSPQAKPSSTRASLDK